MERKEIMVFQLNPTETVIMELFWEKGTWLSGADVWKYFNTSIKKSERSTVNTFLARMAEKGLLVKEKRKYKYAYTREELETKKAEEILTTMYDGSLSKFLAALGGSKKVSREEMDELKNYLEQL